jgi:hypothetical protein
MDILAASRILLATILIASPTMLLAQTVYSWNDEQEVLTYGHNPPPGVNASVVTESSQAYRPEPGETTPYSIAASIKDKDEKEKKDSNTKEVQKLCATARKNLAVIESSASAIVRAKDKDGNVTILSADQKRQRKENNQKIIDENC